MVYGIHVVPATLELAMCPNWHTIACR
jgi:hypothetical protein